MDGILSFSPTEHCVKIAWLKDRFIFLLKLLTFVQAHRFVVNQIVLNGSVFLVLPNILKNNFTLTHELILP